MTNLTPDMLATWRPELDTPVWERFPEATAANAQEVFPGVGDPLSFDVNLIAIEHGSRTFIERIGLTRVLGLDQWRDVGFFAAYYGRPYINIAAFRELVKWVPGGDPDAIDEQLFGASRDQNAPAWKPTRQHQIVRLRTLARLLPLLRDLPRDQRANNVAVEAYMQKIQAADLTAYSDAELMRELDEACRRNLVTCEIHAATTTLTGGSFENLRVFLVKRGFEEVDALMADLCTGLSDVESARPGRELSRLAARVRGSERLRSLFGWTDPEPVLSMLRRSDDPEVVAFRRDFDNFLRAYGYRGVRELGLATQVWAMRPASVIGIVQSYIAQPNLDAEASLHAQEQRRHDATRRVRARLSLPDRLTFGRLLKAAHGGIEGRELAKSQWARSTHAVRLLAREIGRRLHARGVLPEPDDVFFLRLLELKDAMAARPHPDLRARIAHRQEDYERCLQVETDERFVGRPTPRLRLDTTQVQSPGVEAATAVLSAEPGSSDDEPATLRGLAVSPGRVTAPARVVHELTDEVDLEPGEVLVCPFTDAAWTPLFFNAAAVVMDLGGPLSHGSTVAREYGLPAVVNVKTGTRRIVTGQRITVDGTRGEVLLHPDEPVA